LYALEFYNKIDFRKPLIANLPDNNFTFEEVNEIDPKNQKVMLWNFKIYEYDILAITAGYNVFWKDFGVKEAINDLDLYINHMESKIENDPMSRKMYEEKVAEMESDIGIYL
jgi:NADH dehydrogenase FAD-containing subunit